MKLLFVEDDELLRKSYSVFLEDLFDEIIEAQDGKDGLEKYYKYRPDIIMLDISMPHINGMDVIKEIRKNDNDVTIIILSAHSDKSYLFDAIELNIFKYLVKPLPRSLFKEAIAKAIASRSEHEKNDLIYLDDGFVWDSFNKILKKIMKLLILQKMNIKYFLSFVIKIFTILL